MGKTTLCRILLNYGVRLGRRPIFIDLDVGQQNIGIPGTIGGLMVERPADPVEGFDMKAPIVYHFGHTSPNVNYKLYITLIKRIQVIITKQFFKMASKFIIKSPSEIIQKIKHFLWWNQSTTNSNVLTHMI